MKSLQEVGTEILTGKPHSLYILTGPEYGIKAAYIDALKTHYGDIKEMQKVSEVISLMSVKHLVPLIPCVYVVRYDDEFVSGLNEIVAEKLRKLKIVGTLICIYSDAKQSAKLEKFLPDTTTSIDTVAPHFIAKYLKRDYSELPDMLISYIVKYAVNYHQANMMCRSLTYLDKQDLFKVDERDITHLFGVVSETSDALIKQAVAARSFKRCIKVLEDSPQLDNIFYSILSMLIELDKLLDNKYTSSPLREYASRWTRSDVYNMFEHTFHELCQLRSNVGDPYNSLIYLFSLTQFQHIPMWEES